MMFWRVLRGSLRHQRGRLGVATLAVLLGATLISALVNLSFDVSGQAGRELRAYGANILLLPRGESVTDVASIGGTAGEEPGIPEEDLAALENLEEAVGSAPPLTGRGASGVVGYAPYLYLVADTGGQPVVVAGTEFDRVRDVSPWWQVEGRWPVRPEQGLIGAGVAQALGLAPGDQVTLTYGEATHTLTVAGVLQTGGPEDSQVFVPLTVAQTLSDRPGEVGLVQVSALAGGRSVEEVAAAIEARLPDVDARPLQQFTQAEAEVLGRIRRLMALVAALVLVVAALTVGSTLVTAVLERRAEIGLMKALGAGEQRVAAVFLAEALSIGVAGGLIGYAAGLGMAAFIGRQVFQAALSPAPLGLPVTLIVAAGVVLLASLWPVRQALAVDPAVTLRGE